MKNNSESEYVHSHVKYGEYLIFPIVIILLQKSGYR